MYEQISQSKIDFRCTKPQVFFVAMINLNVLLISPEFFFLCATQVTQSQHNKSPFWPSRVNTASRGMGSIGDPTVLWWWLGEGSSNLNESLSGTHFAEHILQTARSYKAWLQCAVAPSFLPPVLGPIRHNEDECLSVRQDILLLHD